MPTEHRVVIKRHRPYLGWALAAAAACALLVGGWGLYRYAQADAAGEFARLRAEREQALANGRRLAAQLRRVEREAQRLREQVAYLERSREIDKQACESVRKSLGSLQARVAELSEQVAFYRGIVSPQETAAGVRVYEFRVRPTAVADVYRYELVLIQSVRHDRPVRGEARFELIGFDGDRQQTLDLSRLSVDGTESLVFSFKYFQEFTGEIRLPPSFRPVRVNLVVDPAGRGRPPVQTEFDWTQVLGG